MESPRIDRTALTARLNRKVPGRRAHLTHLDTRPFGESSLQFSRYRMGNGLTLLVMPDHSAPVLSYHTWYRVGSKHEQPGKTGLAHLFEHLMFNETRQLPAGQFDRIIESAGGETNASTWTDWTHYHSELPSAELELITRLEADRMTNLVLRKSLLDSEKEVVANERRYRVEDDVEGTVAERMYAMAYRRHPYRWPTIGWMKDISGFTTADCRAFYRTYYAPNNATLVVAGDVRESRLLELVQRYYGGMSAARLPELKTPRERPPRVERRLDIPWATPSAKLALGYRAPAFAERDYAVLGVLNEILVGGRGSRLFRSLIQDRALAADVSGSAAPFEDAGMYELWASVRGGEDVDTVLRALDAELKRLQRKTVAEDELQRAKNRMQLGYLSSLETVGGKAEQLGFFEVVCGDGAALFERVAEQRSVTAQDVKRVARTYLQPEGRVHIRVVPTEGASA